ncbi:hypothetical protein CN335_12495 [Bacillus thuringiensis]|uniref:IS3 family transposase n=1 Tax=Bacillus thuringiensis TaxID=1428 RepID=UPI000BF4D283|nr:hypothetical protein CN335_12495 [Bacillus thuringiensis]PFT16203.1 hypothetical protein COK83_11475 [Bacillus thuringiensis]HEB2439605.1 IS3 family transposase [Bacillus thuringiensis]
MYSTSTLKQLIHDYIEYYNTERIQEKLNYLSPIKYKKPVALVFFSCIKFGGHFTLK